MSSLYACKDSVLPLVAGGVGVVGDALLQLGSPHLGGPTGWGLRPYFAIHRRWESITIAGGMMAAFYAMCAALGVPWTYAWMAVVGVLLDLAFRVFRIFPTLDGYYRYMSYPNSALWGAIPMMLPLFVYDCCVADWRGSGGRPYGEERPHAATAPPQAATQTLTPT